MDGIGSIFLDLYILGRGVGTCVSFHGPLSFEGYGWIPEIYVNLYAEALRWKLGHAPLNFRSYRTRNFDTWFWPSSPKQYPTNSKNWAGHSDICLFWASWPAQLVHLSYIWDRPKIELLIYNTTCYTPAQLEGNLRGYLWICRLKLWAHVFTAVPCIRSPAARAFMLISSKQSAAFLFPTARR